MKNLSIIGQFIAHFSKSNTRRRKQLRKIRSKFPGIPDELANQILNLKKPSGRKLYFVESIVPLCYRGVLHKPTGDNPETLHIYESIINTKEHGCLTGMVASGPEKLKVYSTHCVDETRRGVENAESIREGDWLYPEPHGSTIQKAHDRFREVLQHNLVVSMKESGDVSIIECEWNP